MKIVFLDRKTIGEDIDLTPFNRFGEVVIHDFSKPEEVPARVEDADIIILNKVPINEKTIGTAKNLKLVCVTATGVNNLDLDYLASKGIEWRNVAGYSTQTVTQHTFALLFYLFENLAYYDNYVKTDGYTKDFMFTHFEKRFGELCGKTYGIIGLGAIGRQVASVAKAFGCNVIYYSTSGKNHDSEYKEVSFDELLETSDIISIHAPLNDATANLINKDALSKMKKSAILLNLGRGPIVNEKDLADALENGTIRAAGLDVLSVEPIEESNPLLKIKDSTKLLITPHIAWASVEARTRLMKIIEDHIDKFLKNA
ncbi:D-2-hydroxyacid dehydrogenase [Butyrivibrio fibrisolvens]|uniref:D-2-hydroxyacid dehydrogenase n=1 Tax=Butyrivibrio fibrisolvens TaxID=831 RepID=UPI0003B567FC|nr:D-2-hydroxyacid dehydrogenase [Butyrivibrio fibrisolvens]